MQKAKLEAVLVIMVVLVVLAGCSSPARPAAAGPQREIEKLLLPTVETRGSAITEQTGEGTTITFDLLVKNPFQTPIMVQDTAYAVNMEGKALAQGRQDLRIKNIAPSVAPGKEETLTIAVRVKPEEMMAAMTGSRGGDTVEFETDLFVMIDTPTAGPVTLSSKGTGSLPLPPAMGAEVQGVLFDPAGGPGEGWVGLGLTNRNSADIRLQSVTIEVVYSGKITSTATLSLDQPIASGQKAEINLPMSIRPALSPGAKPSPGDVVNYELRGQVVATSPRGPLTMPLRAIGKVSVAE